MQTNERVDRPFGMPHKVSLQKFRPGEVEASVRRWSNVRHQAGINPAPWYGHGIFTYWTEKMAHSGISEGADVNRIDCPIRFLFETQGKKQVYIEITRLVRLSNCGLIE